MEVRLQKWLAQSGVASRRKAEEMILAGRVSVNGVVITELGAKANPQKDKLAVDGNAVDALQDKAYIMLHKPEGVVTTVTDPFERATVMDYVPANPRLYPVGRLDLDTSGLLLMTNDGDWAQKIAHPKNETKKVYAAIVRGVPTPERINSLRKGVIVDGKKTAPAQIKLLEKLQNETKLQITIHEGRNRQVRKMCEAVGHRVVSLKRIEVGGLKLGNLEKGTWRNLTKREIADLRKLTEQNPRQKGTYIQCKR